MKGFNTTGPCMPDEHYMLPPEARLPEARLLLEGRKYFVIHAARQTGKTTLLQCLTDDLNREGRVYALYCTLETARIRPRAEEGIPAILACLRLAARAEPTLRDRPLLPATGGDASSALLETLQGYCAALPKPLVIFFDEADSLADDTLLSFLSQLRNGYVNRGRAPFPVSVALVGMRNLRDYRARVRPEGATLGSASPFNIIVEALTLRDFSPAEVATLYAQHTAVGGRVFTPEAVARVWEQTRGQPWLVNATARELVEKLFPGREDLPVTAAHIDQALEALILRRDTHIDSLIERLKEDRVRRVVEPVLLGDNPPWDTLQDDVRYVLDLGLLRDEGGVLLPANPVYREVIIRVLSWNGQEALGRLETPPAAPLYLTDGHFDMSKLLRAFQEFWRGNAESWTERFEYKEAAPHLLLMAYLQRVVNGGGTVQREFALGMGRMDLLVEFTGERYPLEIKLRRHERTEAEGLRQLGGYLQRLGAAEGWLVVFDRRTDVPWDAKIAWRTEALADGRTIHVVGC